MAREFKRTDRVAEQMQREMAQIIQMEVRDPRIGMVTVSAVDMSRDLRYATVFVTFMGIDEDDKSIKQALKVLNEAASYMRVLIGKRMKMRVVPELKFEFDASIARGSELSALIKNARDKDGDEDKDVDLGVNSAANSDPKQVDKSE